MKLLVLLLLTSCAKISYIAEQGAGQMALEWNGKTNNNILTDDKTSIKHKNKIKLIEKAKKYFYDFYNLPQTDIYDETTILESEAVTYLVISSPKDKIQATITSFPIVGDFPYLGFFNKQSAMEYAKKEKKKNRHTYMRNVYAYSTLNQWIFDDNILSSFFYYKDQDLVELIFHELVHTLLFVDSEVEFNENLAQFIAEKMLINYLKISEDKIIADKARMKKLKQIIVKSGQELNDQYIRKKEYDLVLARYLEQIFFPQVKKTCKDEGVKNCWPLKGEWNNARFAAFKTYESKQSKIATIFDRWKLPLKDFLIKIIKLEENFDEKMSFTEYLEKQKV